MLSRALFKDLQRNKWEIPRRKEQEHNRSERVWATQKSIRWVSGRQQESAE